MHPPARFVELVLLLTSPEIINLLHMNLSVTVCESQKDALLQMRLRVQRQLVALRQLCFRTSAHKQRTRHLPGPGFHLVSAAMSLT